MARSLRSREGYLQVDHRQSPGVPDALVEAARRAGHDPFNAPTGQQLESATYTCGHCQALVVVGPTRTRPLNYCAQGDHYVCDGCEYRRVRLGHGCVPLARILDIALGMLTRGVV